MGWAKSESRPADRGFTLIEIVVVLVILSVVVLLVFPRLPSSEGTRLRNSGRALAAVIRYLGDRSVTTKTAYRLHFDLSNGGVTVRKLAGKEEVSPEDPFFSRPLLADGVTVEDVEVPSLGRVAIGEVAVPFGPSGLGEFLVVHLKGTKGDHLTVIAYPENGKVTVLEGYQELQP